MGRKSLATILLCGAFTLLAMAQKPTPVGPDNTKQNKGNGITAEHQGNGKADLDMTQKIRKAIMDEKSLSTYAHNVKVVTNNGMVYLKGPVKSEDEKSTIEAKAKEIAGAENVKSRLTIAPSKD